MAVPVLATTPGDILKAIRLVLRVLWRLGFVVTGLVMTALVLGFLSLFFTMDYLRWRDDGGYADRLFSAHVPIAEVLASRQWHPRGGEAWDCTYAIARLGPDAPDAPPSWEDEEGRWYLHFGGAWQPTPLPKLGHTKRDTLAFCAKYWPKEVNQSITRATTLSGNWMIRSGSAATVYIYAPTERLIARIRYDD